MAGDNCVCVLASCRTERLLTTVAKVYVTRGRCVITAENNFSSAERQISAKAGRSGGTKRLRWLRLMNASSRWRSAPLVNPHQALEAYVSLELCTGADDAMCMF